MTTMLDNWETIPAPRGSTILNVLRADATHPMDFRIGRDAAGRFAFQLDADGAAPDAGSVESPAGMDVVFDEADDGVLRLTLLLHDPEDFAIFRVLCGDLLDVTRPLGANNTGKALRMLLGRLGHWQQVLARRRSRRLSRQEEIGLFGELLFLRDVLSIRMGFATAIGAWRGPYGDEQDFALPSALVEVKTQGASSDARLMVSSENQLDTSSGPIFLCRQRIAMAPASAGESLDALVSQLLATTADLSAANVRFRTGLDAAGWTDKAGYDQCWSVTDRTFFCITDGFPRIVPTDLLPGVSRVRYQVSIADCLPFSVNEAEVFA